MVRPSISNNGVDEKPRSIPNNKYVSVCYINGTNRIVHVLWLDFQGNPVLYCSLAPRCGVQIHTYEQHPWIIVDSETGDRMLAAGEEVYYPLQDKNKMIPVLITRPLLTLREHALHKVRDSVDKFEDIQSLEIPSSLMNDIKRVMMLKKSALDSYTKCKRYQTLLQ